MKWTKQYKAVYHAEWWRKLPASEKCAYNLKSSCRKMGITVEDYKRLLKKQKGVCAICKNPESIKTTTKWRLSVDHDHKTEKVRGLLCTSCNHLLGKANDDPRILKAAVKYLATVR